MKPRPVIPARSSSSTPIVIVIVSVALIGGLAWYFLTHQEPERVQSQAEKAEPLALPAITADPALKTGPSRVRLSDWKFEDSPDKSPKKIVGRVSFEADDKDEVLKGGFFGDLKYTLYSAGGEKLKVGYLPFGALRSGESSETEIDFGAWKRVKRIWIERFLREAKEK